MKSREFISEGQDLNSLGQAIVAGDSPSINNAAYTADGYSWGDLRDLGLATKVSNRKTANTVEQYWE